MSNVKTVKGEMGDWSWLNLLINYSLIELTQFNNDELHEAVIDLTAYKGRVFEIIDKSVFGVRLHYAALDKTELQLRRIRGIQANRMRRRKRFA